MFSGYVSRRSSALGPPPLSRRFCQLWGTQLWDFASEEQAATLRPDSIVEILGVSEWDGQDRVAKYSHGFMLVTHTGTTLYLNASSSTNRLEWMTHVRAALEANFANEELAGLRPSKLVVPKGAPAHSGRCAKTGVVLSVHYATFCPSCGRGFVAAEYSSQPAPLLHLGREEAVRVCVLCADLQLALSWIKCLNYVNTDYLHRHSSTAREDVLRFKSTFRLLRLTVPQAEMAGKLFDQEDISATELRELMAVEHRAQQDAEHRSCAELFSALEVMGSDMQTILGLLLSSKLIRAGDKGAYKTIANRVVRLAEEDSEVVDFYWPQVLHAHFLESRLLTPVGLLHMGLLQESLLSIALRFPRLALKTAWHCAGVMSDFMEKRASPGQYAASAVLLLQLDMVMGGSSSILSEGKVFADLFRGASHQRQELRTELSTLFRTRSFVNDSDREALRRRAATIPPSVPRSQADLALLALLEEAETVESCAGLFAYVATALSALAPQATSFINPYPPPPLPLLHAPATNMQFASQLEFVQALVALVDALRLVDRSTRSERLRRDLRRLSSATSFGFDPIGSAWEPRYRITKVHYNDCRVFRTKARAPSMLVCEVIKEDFNGVGIEPMRVQRKRSRVFSSEAAVAAKIDTARLLETLRAQTASPLGSPRMPPAMPPSATPVRTHSLSPVGPPPARSFSEGDLKEEDLLGVPSPPVPKSVSSSPLIGTGNDSMERERSMSRKVLSSMSKSRPGRRLFRPASLSGAAGRRNTASRATGLIAEIARSSPRSPQKQSVLELDAANMLQEGLINELEFLSLIKCEERFRQDEALEEETRVQARLATVFGDSWLLRKQRALGERFSIRTYLSDDDDEEESENGGDRQTDWPQWDLRCFIVKSNDDLRQEVCCLQLLEIFREIFRDVGLGEDLWLQPYRIVSTGSSSGLVEVVPDTVSLDALKKTPGFAGLAIHFDRMYGTSPSRVERAKRKFVSSLAAYSLACYVLQIKDRHNGNILLDTEGYLIHIDFGFILSIAPGGAFSLESAPFKLTAEMMEVMGGLDSPLFERFVRAFTSGFLALRDNADVVLQTVGLLATDSPFPCMQGLDPEAVLDRLRGRLRKDLSVGACIQHCLDLVIESHGHYGTAQYDSFQWLTNGIVA